MTQATPTAAARIPACVEDELRAPAGGLSLKARCAMQALAYLNPDRATVPPKSCFGFELALHQVQCIW